jgi:hypothetical protein
MGKGHKELLWPSAAAASPLPPVPRDQSEHLWQTPTARKLLQAFKIGGVDEDQRPVIELDRPSSAGFGDTSVDDGDGVSSRIAEVFDDDPKSFVTAGGVNPHTVADREVRTV